MGWRGSRARRLGLLHPGVPRRVERFGFRENESFEFFHVRIPLKFCQNSGNILTILQKFRNFKTFSTFSRMFGEIPKKPSASVQNSMKIIEKIFLKRNSREQKFEKV